VIHLLQVVVRIDNREYKFEGRSSHGAALVVSFREWLATVPAVAAVEADTLEHEVAWSGANERDGSATVSLASSDHMRSSLDLSKSIDNGGTSKV